MSKIRTPQDIKVRVWGMARWDRVFAELLRSVGVSAFVSKPVGHLPFLKRIRETVSEIRHLDIEHVMFPSRPERFHRIARFVGTHVVYHWIGSDVLKLQKLPPAQREAAIRSLKSCKPTFMADGMHLVEELEKLGIEAHSVSVMPLGVVGPVYPMPEKFTVLSYWGLRPQFYGSDIVLALAREMSDVEFLIVGGDAQRLEAPPNVKYLGNVDMEDVYRRTSVLLRLPEHDGTSKMLLEALSRGRWAVYSRPCPGTLHAADVESARAALRQLKQQTLPNTEGASYVRCNYSPQVEAQKALAIYRQILS